MKETLIRQLMEITEEEQELLRDQTHIRKERYTNLGKFEIDSKKLLERDKYITMRTHTRFVDFPMHTHNYIEIMYVCQGTITHYMDGNEICMGEGDLLFLNQQVSHGTKRAEKEDIGINFIALPEFFDIPLGMLKKDNVLADFLIHTLRTQSAEPEYLLFHTKGDMAIENLMENIVASLLRGDTAEENINQISMGLVFLHLLNHIDTIGKQSSRTYKEILVNSVLQYIHRNYKDATLTEVAGDLHQSVSQLSKLIKKETGNTFQELLQRRKFERAVELLQETSLTIAEIFAAVGYENSSYFYRKFHEKYEMSPKAFRKEWQIRS